MIQFISENGDSKQFDFSAIKSGYVYCSAKKYFPPMKVNIVLMATDVAYIFNAENDALTFIWHISNENHTIYETFKAADMALRSELYIDFTEKVQMLNENCADALYDFVCQLSEGDVNKKQKIENFLNTYEDKCKMFLEKAEEGKKKYSELMKHSIKKKHLPF